VLLAKALSGGFVPLGAVACRREVFDRVFDRMDRALVHGSTFQERSRDGRRSGDALMDRASKGLFCQLILIPLLRDHRILAQVAGHDLPVVRLLPPLVLSEEDLDWAVRGSPR
jgi:ornithine--oxo-acid transaminase